jgi:DNA-binding transcriptional regulator LsrR (DeoR family)
MKVVKRIKKKSRTMIGIEERFGEELEELLRRLYVDEGKTNEEVAQTLSITKVSAIRWLEKAGIYSHKLDI